MRIASKPRCMRMYTILLTINQKPCIVMMIELTPFDLNGLFAVYYLLRKLFQEQYKHVKRRYNWKYSYCIELFKTE